MKISATNISFCAYKSRFAERFETALNSKPEANKEEILSIDFKDVFQKHYSKDYYIGGGAFNRVYKIDDYYVMRFNKKLPLDDTNMEFVRIQQRHPELKTYYGRTLAKFGRICIQKNAIGDKNALTFENHIAEGDYKSNLKYFKTVFLPTIAQLPQKAFNDLFSDMKILKDSGYRYDTKNPANFIAVDDKIKVVDDIELLGHVNPVVDFLFNFTNFSISYFDLNFEDKNNLNIILKKMFTAIFNAGLKLDAEKNECYYYNVFGNTNVNYNAIFKIENAMEKASSEKEFTEKLDKIFGL